MTIETYQAWRRRIACAKYRAANREKANTAQATYRAANPVRSREWANAHPERSNAIKRKWRKEHPGAVCASNAARRTLARKQRCTCCTNAEIRHVYDIAALIGAEVDHIKPLALGGPHCAKNLQALTVEEHKEKTRMDRSAIAAYHHLAFCHRSSVFCPN
jgi:hypothetical protein